MRDEVKHTIKLIILLQLQVFIVIIGKLLPQLMQVLKNRANQTVDDYKYWRSNQKPTAVWPPHSLFCDCKKCSVSIKLHTKRIGN